MKFIRIALTYLLILAGAALFLIPLLWMVTVSLSTPEQVAQPGIRLFPTQLKWDNYKTALTLMPFSKYAMNTVTVTFSRSWAGCFRARWLRSHSHGSRLRAKTRCSY